MVVICFEPQHSSLTEPLSLLLALVILSVYGLWIFSECHFSQNLTGCSHTSWEVVWTEMKVLPHRPAVALETMSVY